MKKVYFYSKSLITILSDEQLKAKNTRNLLFILKKARTALGRFNDKYFCPECRDFHMPKEREEQEKFEIELARYQNYFDKIKAILATREHVA